jgi:hypothetical protein
LSAWESEPGFAPIFDDAAPPSEADALVALMLDMPAFAAFGQHLRDYNCMASNRKIAAWGAPPTWVSSGHGALADFTVTAALDETDYVRRAARIVMVDSLTQWSLNAALLAPIVYALIMMGFVPEGLLPGIPAPTAGHVFDVVYTLAEAPRYAPLFYQATRVARRCVVKMLQREGKLGPARIATNGIVRQAWPHGCLADDAVYGQLVPVQTETVTAAGSGSGRRTRGGQAAPAAAGTAGGGEEQRQARGTKRDHEQ